HFNAMYNTRRTALSCPFLSSSIPGPRRPHRARRWILRTVRRFHEAARPLVLAAQEVHGEGAPPERERAGRGRAPLERVRAVRRREDAPRGLLSGPHAELRVDDHAFLEAQVAGDPARLHPELARVPVELDELARLDQDRARDLAGERDVAVRDRPVVVGLA